MIAREIIISALREWMAEIGKRASVAVSWVGKVKTASVKCWHCGYLYGNYNDVDGLGRLCAALYVATSS